MVKDFFPSLEMSDVHIQIIFIISQSHFCHLVAGFSAALDSVFYHGAVVAQTMTSTWCIL